MAVKTNACGFTKADLETDYVNANIHAKLSGDCWEVWIGFDQTSLQIFHEPDLREAVKFFTMLADELKRRG